MVQTWLQSWHVFKQSSGKKSRSGTRINHGTTLILIGEQYINLGYVHMHWLAECNIVGSFSNS